ncbi:hypothetical protein BGX20_003827, partial [Mortierella sp. AD010]
MIFSFSHINDKPSIPGEVLQPALRDRESKFNVDSCRDDPANQYYIQHIPAEPIL